MIHPLVLASGSPRRRKLLEEAGVSFTVVVPEVDEFWPDSDPVQAVELAVCKARAVAKSRLTGEVVLAADTIVRLRGRVLGKPRDDAEARAMLSSLSGAEHTVTTGVAAMPAPEGDPLTVRVDSRVRIRRLTPGEIDDYVATGSPLDKAGAYAVQDERWNLVERVEGSVTNVIGLPMEETLKLLETLDKTWNQHARRR
ncbi:MAG: septum formation protein Maf [Candidatus Coatesbacteria bacterium RBG_13_66_14]|uniref:dTTP/UTP pyrophosphatase n=1 Tax=Candidatus Coatesbacteria bacterium RBG_13_66_14 TaxID=1817816 RepID=A0A1F5FG68_9BACT|nr:MAG: septum formation protein Maf [Candidatus Coatesbacteria bacterium RBG_13_66_14]